MNDIEKLADSIFCAVKQYTAVQLDLRLKETIEDIQRYVAEQITRIPAGKDGAPGAKGVPGAKGDTGERGDNGEKGADGQPAIDGLPGRDGQDGRDGRDGKDGEPGRDALECEPLSGIDESKSYRRGTLTLHRNGMWRAYRTTDPVVDKNFEAAGWQVISGGVAEMQCELEEDQRTLVVTFVATDGKSFTQRLKLPITIYQDVWEAREYQKGDTVTLAGSTWHANYINQDRPGTSKAWTLMVKRGSNGKDLRQEVTA